MQHTDPGVRWDEDEFIVAPGRQWGPGRVFSALFIAATITAGALWLWTTSVPGFRFLGALVTFNAFMAIGVIWVVSAVITAWRLATKRIRRPGWFLFVAPAIGLALIIVTVLALPVRARFEFARSDFDLYAQDVLTAAEGIDPATVQTAADPGWDVIHPDAPDSIGGFALRNASIVPEGLIIFDTEGAFFDDAGFAYLPDGTFPPGTGSFESPRFRSLGGDWYAFTSSW